VHTDIPGIYLVMRLDGVHWSVLLVRSVNEFTWAGYFYNFVGFVICTFNPLVLESVCSYFGWSVKLVVVLFWCGFVRL